MIFQKETTIQATLIASPVQIVLVTDASMYTVVTDNALEEVLTMAEYIERKALRKVMQMATDDPTCPMHIAATVDQYITEAPAADVAPVRHGRWEFKDDDGAYPWTTKAICSECKKVIAWNARLSLKNNQIEFAHENHYCLNCGAIMDGVKA